MLRRPLVVGLFVLFVAGTLDATWAQPPQGGRRPGGIVLGGFGGGPGGPGGGLGEGMLLSNEQVQKELELTTEQVADLGKLRESQQTQMRESFSGLRDLSEEERRAKFEELRPKLEAAQKESREKLLEILLPHQQERLKQISLQLRGPAAIDDPEVASELKITDEQKEKLASTRETLREKMQALFREGAGGEGMREKFQALRKENEEALLGVLTAEQRERLEKLKGEKFELDMSQFGRGPGGPAGGRFGGRRPGGEQPGGNRPEGDRPTPNQDT